jgi:hypothetical protein
MARPEEDVDLLSLLPASWVARARSVRSRWRPVDTVALLVVVLLPLVVVGALVVRGSLYIDDFRAQTYASGQPFWPWIVESNGTHFAPGARTVDWIQTRFFPLQHWFAAVVTLAVRVILGASAWAVLRRLVGPRWSTLAVLVVLVSTASLLPATAWYRQSITALPATIAILLCTDSHIRFVRRPTWRGVLETVLWLALGLCFLEKAVVVVPWLFGLSVFLLPRVLGMPVRRVLTRAAISVAATTALVVAFLGFYLGSGSYDKGDAGSIRLADVLEMLWLNLTHALAPAVVGGPWQWAYPQPYYGAGDPPFWLLATSGLVVVGMLGYGLGRTPTRTLGALAAFLCFYLPCAAVVAVGRLARIGPAAGAELRLWPDAMVMAIIVLAVIVLRPRADRRRDPVGQLGGPHLSARAVGATAAALVAVMINVGHSTVLFADEWVQNPSGAYVANLKADLATAGSTPHLVSVSAPVVVPNWVDPDYATEQLLAPLRTTATFHLDLPDTKVPLEDGHLVAPRWVTAGNAVPPPVGWCGYRIPPGGSAFRIAFPTAVPYYRDAQLRLAVLTSQPTALEVLLTDTDGHVATPVTRTSVQLDRGAFRLLLRLPDGLRPTSFTIRAVEAAAGLCVTGASVASPSVDSLSAEALASGGGS